MLICQSVAEGQLTGVAPLGAVSHRFNLLTSYQRRLYLNSVLWQCSQEAWFSYGWLYLCLLYLILQCCLWSHGLQPKTKIFKSQCGGASSSCPGSQPKSTYLDCRVCRLMIRVVLRQYRELCTDLLAFTLQLRKTWENLSQYSPQMGSITCKCGRHDHTARLKGRCVERGKDGGGGLFIWNLKLERNPPVFVILQSAIRNS